MSDGNNPLATIAHEPESALFANREGGALHYELDADGCFVITHVEVPEHLRGGGVAARLVEAALLYADQNRLEVVPECSYAAAYLKRHRKPR